MSFFMTFQALSMVNILNHIKYVSSFNLYIKLTSVYAILCGKKQTLK